MQRTVASSVILLWLGQFVRRQGQRYFGTASWTSSQLKCQCNFTHTFSLTQLQHPFSSKALAQTTVTGCDPTHTCLGNKWRSNFRAEAQGLLQQTQNNTKERFYSYHSFAHRNTDTVDAATNLTRWIPFTEMFVGVWLRKVPRCLRHKQAIPKCQSF